MRGAARTNQTSKTELFCKNRQLFPQKAPS